MKAHSSFKCETFSDSDFESAIAIASRIRKSPHWFSPNPDNGEAVREDILELAWEIAESQLWLDKEMQSGALFDEDELRDDFESLNLEIDELVGIGGMGCVYSALDLKLNRRVALKVLRPAFQDDKNAVRCFFDEAHILARLQHPGIPPIHDFGITENGLPYIVMRYLASDQRFFNASAKSDSLATSIQRFTELAEVVGYAHSNSIIHRDLKPGNIIVQDRIMVVDWGVATELSEPESRRRLQVGTRSYLSPEQAKGEVVDERTDVFSLGCILLEMITGRPVYERSNVLAQAASCDTSRAIQRLKSKCTDNDVVAICETCLHRDSTQRFSSANELVHALKSWREKQEASQRELVHSQIRQRQWFKFACYFSLAMAICACFFAWLMFSYLAQKNIAVASSEIANDERLIRMNLEDRSFESIGRGLSSTSQVAKEFLQLRLELEKTSLANLPNTSQLREARLAGQIRVGRIYFDLGDVNQAIEQFQLTEDLLKQLVEEKSEYAVNTLPRFYRDLAVGYSLIGDIESARRSNQLASQAASDCLLPREEKLHLQASILSNSGMQEYEIGKLDLADQAFLSAIELLENGNSNSPSNFELQELLADTRTKYGLLLLDRGIPAQAEDQIKQAIAARSLIAETHPSVLLNLAESHSSLGTVLSELGNYDDAKTAFNKALDARKKIITNASAEWVNDQAVDSANLASIIGNSDPERAIELIKKIVPAQSELANFHSDNGIFHQTLSLLYDGLADCEFSRGDLDESLQWSKKAVHESRLSVKLLGQDSAQIDLAKALSDQAITYRKMNTKESFGLALDSYNESIQLFQEVVASRKDPSVKFSLGVNLFNRANLHRLSGDYPKAIADVEKAKSLIGQIAAGNQRYESTWSKISKYLVALKREAEKKSRQL